MPCHRKRDFFNILYAVLNQSNHSITMAATITVTVRVATIM